MFGKILACPVKQCIAMMKVLVRSCSSSALLKIVQLRLPDIEKTYMDLVQQHRAGYKQK